MKMAHQQGEIEDESVFEIIESRIFRQVWFKITEKPITFPCTFHRVRGPAVITRDGKEFWYRHGKPYTPTAHELMMWELRKKNESA